MNSRRRVNSAVGLISLRTANTRITAFRIMQDSAKHRLIHLLFRATFASMVFAFWTVPMIVFCVVVWRKGNIISTVVFLLGAGLSLMMFYLPEQYYQPKSFELNGRFYERLGIRFYKRWMMNGDYMNS